MIDLVIKFFMIVTMISLILNCKEKCHACSFHYQHEIRIWTCHNFSITKQFLKWKFIVRKDDIFIKLSNELKAIVKTYWSLNSIFLKSCYHFKLHSIWSILYINIFSFRMMGRISTKLKLKDRIHFPDFLGRRENNKLEEP